MPRIKSDQERGYIAAWMRRERLGRDWSQKDMPQKLATVGVDVDYDYYRQIEAGPKPPGPDLLDGLKRLYGTEPEPFPEAEPPTDVAALVRAIEAQTDAINALADALKAQHDDAPVWAQAVVSAVLAGRQLLPTEKEPAER